MVHQDSITGRLHAAVASRQYHWNISSLPKIDIGAAEVDVACLHDQIRCVVQAPVLLDLPYHPL